MANKLSNDKLGEFNFVFLNTYFKIIAKITKTYKGTLLQSCRPSSVVERVAFNHVVVGSIPTDGGLFLDCFFSSFLLTKGFKFSCVVLHG